MTDAVKTGTEKLVIVDEGIELTVPERMRLMALLPEQGNLITMLTLRKLRESLSLAEDISEGAVTLIPHPSGDSQKDQVKWENDYVRSIPFSKGARAMVYSQLKRLDSESKLTQADLSLCEKFLDTPPQVG